LSGATSDADRTRRKTSYSSCSAQQHKSVRCDCHAAASAAAIQDCNVCILHPACSFNADRQSMKTAIYTSVCMMHAACSLLADHHAHLEGARCRAHGNGSRVPGLSPVPGHSAGLGLAGHSGRYRRKDALLICIQQALALRLQLVALAIHQRPRHQHKKPAQRISVLSVLMPLQDAFLLPAVCLTCTARASYSTALCKTLRDLAGFCHHDAWRANIGQARTRRPA
jgi:hypothetical protein